MRAKEETLIKPEPEYYIVRVLPEEEKTLIVFMRQQPKKNLLSEVLAIGSANPHNLNEGDKVWITNKNTSIKFKGESCLVVNEKNIVAYV